MIKYKENSFFNNKEKNMKKLILILGIAVFGLLDYAHAKHDLNKLPRHDKQINDSNEQEKKINSSHWKKIKASPYPVAIFHGISNSCSTQDTMGFVNFIATQANTFAKCVEVGDGAPATWLMAFQTQVSTACIALRKVPEFANGVNIIGLSQGGLIARAMTEQCDVTVYNLITLGTPHMGVMSIPDCESGFYCDIYNAALDHEVYDPYMQNNFGPPGFFKDQYKYDEYLAKSSFLAAANNERSINPIYTSGFTSIN